MEFYLYETSSPDRKLCFPINPEEIIITAGTQTQAINVLELGEISMPRGRRATRYSWSGIFPGAGRYGILPFPPTLWRPPIDVLNDLETWHGNGTKLGLLVTETELNKDVFISNLAHSWGKGSAYGDLIYQIELTEYRSLIVTADGEAPSGEGLNTEDESRSDTAVPATYSVAEDDTLWTIAKKLWDDGSRWQEIYDANSDAIGSDPDLIPVGMELQIPGGEG